jgi:hypothetical protein
MHFVLAEHIDEVLEAALEKPLPDVPLPTDLLDTIEVPGARQPEIAVVA